MSSPEENPSLTPRGLLRAAFLVEGGMGLLGLGIVAFFDLPLTDSRFSWWQTVLLSLAGTAPLLLMIAAFYRWPPSWLEEINRFLDRILPVFRRLSVPQLILICALAGFGEELLFRAAFQNLFVEAFGLIIGLILGSMLFGIFHALTRAYFLLAMGMGLYLGAIYHFTQDLPLVMLIHGLYDLGVFLMLLRSDEKTPEPPEDPVE